MQPLISSSFVRALTLLATIASFSAIAAAQSANPFVPGEFVVPATLETKEFRLRMLTVNDVVKDYDAVMTSVEHLKTIWPDGSWPEGLTFEQDLIDLGWHQKEFQRRRSFAYTVVTSLGVTRHRMRLHQPDPKARVRRSCLSLGEAKRAQERARNTALFRSSRVGREGMALQESGVSRARH